MVKPCIVVDTPLTPVFVPGRRSRKKGISLTPSASPQQVHAPNKLTKTPQTPEKMCSPPKSPRHIALSAPRPVFKTVPPIAPPIVKMGRCSVKQTVTPLPYICCNSPQHHNRKTRRRTTKKSTLPPTRTLSMVRTPMGRLKSKEKTDSTHLPLGNANSHDL